MLWTSSGEGKKEVIETKKNVLRLYKQEAKTLKGCEPNLEGGSLMEKERENSNSKARVSKWFIIGTVLFLILLFVGIGIPCIYSQNQKHLEEQRINGQLDNQKDKTGFFAKSYVEYSKEELDAIVGVELRQTEREMCGYSCMEYWNNQNTPTRFDDLRFYLFDTQKDAEKVLKEIKKDSFREITDEGEDFVRGWLEGVVDADVERYYYQHGNLIITTVTTSVDESPRDMNDTSPAVVGGGQEAEDLIRLIRAYF